MDLITIYKLALGCNILWIIFMLINITVHTIGGAILYKLIPLIFTVIIIFYQLVENGFVLRV